MTFDDALQKLLDYSADLAVELADALPHPTDPDADAAWRVRLLAMAWRKAVADRYISYQLDDPAATELGQLLFKTENGELLDWEQPVYLPGAKAAIMHINGRETVALDPLLASAQPASIYYVQKAKEILEQVASLEQPLGSTEAHA